MRDSDRSTLIVLIAIGAGFLLGYYTCTQTSDHKLLMEEYKKAKGINMLIDAKLQQSITDYKKGVSK